MPSHHSALITAAAMTMVQTQACDSFGQWHIHLREIVIENALRLCGGEHRVFLAFRIDSDL